MIKVSYPAGDNERYRKILIPMLNQLHSEWMSQGATDRPWPGYDILMMEQFGYVFDETTVTFTFENDSDYTAFLLRWS